METLSDKIYFKPSYSQGIVINFDALNLKDVLEAVKKLKEEVNTDRWITDDDKKLFYNYIDEIFGSKLT